MHNYVDIDKHTHNPVTLYLGQNRYRKPRCRIGLFNLWKEFLSSIQFQFTQWILFINPTFILSFAL